MLGLFAAVPAIVIGILVITRGRPGLGAAIITLAVVLPIATAVTFFAVLDGHAYRVPSESMGPTLNVGERLITTKVSQPKRGDIVVFEAPQGALRDTCGVRHPSGSVCPRPTPARSDTKFIKRVTAVGGDRVKVIDGRVYIDGRRQAEPDVRANSVCEACNLPREVTIPDGYYFMVGDSRGQSADSRTWGPVPSDWIIGKVRLRYWPLSAFGSP